MSITHQSKKLTLCFYSHTFTPGLKKVLNHLQHPQMPSKNRTALQQLRHINFKWLPFKTLGFVSRSESYFSGKEGGRWIYDKNASFLILTIIQFLCWIHSVFFFLVDWLTKITYFLLLILGDPMCSTRRPLLSPWERVYNPKSVPLHHQPRGRIRYAMIKVQIHTWRRGCNTDRGFAFH